MKKRVLLPLVLCFMALLLNACDKCQVCTQSSAPEIRICRGDYDSDTAYDLAITAAEFGGYSCN